MRILILHVDYFKCKITEKGRSKIFEEYSNPSTEVDESLVILSSVEKRDESHSKEIAEKASKEIMEFADKLKVTTVVLHPFAHLFGELSSPQVAIEVIKSIEKRLTQENLRVIRTPFGWFNTLEIKAKGHPLSRVARIITSD